MAAAIAPDRKLPVSPPVAQSNAPHFLTSFVLGTVAGKQQETDSEVFTPAPTTLYKFKNAVSFDCVPVPDGHCLCSWVIPKDGLGSRSAAIRCVFFYGKCILDHFSRSLNSSAEATKPSRS